MTLPLGTETVSGTLPTDTPVIENSALDAAIKISGAEIAAEQTKPLKRGRGRPKKKRPAATEPSMAQAAPGAPSVESVPEIDLKPIMAQVIKLPFDIAANRTHCPLVRLTESDVKEPAELANQLFNAYAPELASQDPRRVLAFSFAFSICMLGVAKAQAYAAWKIQTVEQTVTETTADGTQTQTTVRTESAPPPAANFAAQMNAEPIDPFRRGPAPGMSV